MTPQSDDMDLRPRMVRVEHDLTDHHRRLTELEKHRQTADIADARRDEQWANMLAKIDAIDGNIKWVVKLIIGGIIAGAVGFMLKGGFSLPG
ncbi:hemolysin XhlA family protein [Rhizobium puerariae]|uniref:Hemolysin XhlA family protein n=1 Tax=Rhizobium puerariae TaxID=1585791 RepID=A0ABV6AN98_9HYPH